MRIHGQGCCQGSCSSPLMHPPCNPGSGWPMRRGTRPPRRGVWWPQTTRRVPRSTRRMGNGHGTSGGVGEAPGVRRGGPGVRQGAAGKKISQKVGSYTEPIFAPLAGERAVTPPTHRCKRTNASQSRPQAASCSMLLVPALSVLYRCQSAPQPVHFFVVLAPFGCWELAGRCVCGFVVACGLAQRASQRPSACPFITKSTSLSGTLLPPPSPPVPRPSFTHQCARFARASTGSALPMHTLCFVTTHFVLWFCSPPPPVRKQAPRPRNDARSFRESERWWRIWGDAAGARTFAVPIGTTHSRSKGLCGAGPFWALVRRRACVCGCVWPGSLLWRLASAGHKPTPICIPFVIVHLTPPPTRGNPENKKLPPESTAPAALRITPSHYTSRQTPRLMICPT